MRTSRRTWTWAQDWTVDPGTPPAAPLWYRHLQDERKRLLISCLPVILSLLLSWPSSLHWHRKKKKNACRAFFTHTNTLSHTPTRSHTADCLAFSPQTIIKSFYSVVLVTRARAATTRPLLLPCFRARSQAAATRAESVQLYIYAPYQADKNAIHSAARTIITAFWSFQLCVTTATSRPDTSRRSLLSAARLLTEVLKLLLKRKEDNTLFLFWHALSLSAMLSVDRLFRARRDSRWAQLPSERSFHLTK